MEVAMRLTVLLPILAMVVALAAAGVLLLEPAPALAEGIHREVGQALAEQALRQLHPGARITVITRDTSAFPQPAVDLALSAFDAAVHRAGTTQVSVERLQIDPLRPLELPPGDTLDILRRAVVGDVIVSFMGPPRLSDEQRLALGAIKPKVVAFCPGSLPSYLDLRLLAEQNLLHAAVLSRPHPTPPGGASRETFDTSYVRATAADLAQRPAP